MTCNRVGSIIQTSLKETRIVVVTGNDEAKMIHLFLRGNQYFSVGKGDVDPPPRNTSNLLSEIEMNVKNRSTFLSKDGICTYNNAKETWDLCPVTHINLGSRAFVLEDFIVITGGYYSKDVHMIKNEDNLVEACKLIRCKSKAPIPSSHFSTSRVTTGKVIISGGYSNGGGRSSDVYEASLASDKGDVLWNRLPSLMRRRDDHTSFVMSDTLYVVGGVIGFQYACFTIEMYDINEKQWSDGGKLPFPLFTASSVVDEEEKVAIVFGSQGYDKNMKILLFTGSNEMTFYKELEFDNKFAYFSISPIT